MFHHQSRIQNSHVGWDGWGRWGGGYRGLGEAHKHKKELTAVKKAASGVKIFTKTSMFVHKLAARLPNPSGSMLGIKTMKIFLHSGVGMQLRRVLFQQSFQSWG